MPLSLDRTWVSAVSATDPESRSKVGDFRSVAVQTYVLLPRDWDCRQAAIGPRALSSVPILV